jgi:hypothetical protein
VTNYQIQSSSRHCARTGRELKPGEKFYGVLYDRGANFVREDWSVDAWQGPPADAFSFWLGRLPSDNQPRRIQVDEGLLIDCLERLAEETTPAKVNFRYVLALLLMRRKRLKFEEVARVEGQEYLALRCVRTRKLYRVLNPQLTDEQIADVQDEVQKVLGLA